MFNTNTIIETNTEFPYSKKVKTQVVNHRNSKFKIDKPISNNLSQLVNNFLIHQKIWQTPNNLKQLFIGNNEKNLSVVNIGGKLVVIIFFKYPGFQPNIPGSKTEIRKITKDVITNNPSYLCVFDFKTYQVLDVVQVPGDIKYIYTYWQFVAIAYSNKFSDEQNYLLSFAVSPISHKLIQIHQSIDIGMNKLHSIQINYINLDTHSDDNTIPNGRLIIYCCSSPKIHNDYLITLNHFTYSDSWKLHKMLVVSDISVDITKYTQTDYLAGIFHGNEENRIVAIHMDNPSIYYSVSEIYQQKHKATSLCTNDYILHPDGRLEIINFNFGREPLKSIKYTWRQLEKIISQYTYPLNKGGIEIIYSTILETSHSPASQELVFGTYNFTVKNGIQEYQLQPGKIMKYACMKNIYKQNDGKIYQHATHSTEIDLNYQCKFIYSPDGKYLAQIIECSEYNNFYGKMLGILVYTKNYSDKTKLGGINPGIWRECMYINSYDKQLTVNFIPEIKSNDQHPVDYNLIIMTGNCGNYKNYTFIHTPNVLADKYCHMLSNTITPLGYNNIKTISRFIAANKLRYVNLSNVSKSSYSSLRNNKDLTGYKIIIKKMNI